MSSMSEELDAYMNALARDECYRVETVLKESACETTQKVWFKGANGAERGPYVRKYLDADSGLGAAYERIWRAQRVGRRFRYLPRIEECYVAGEQRVTVMEFVEGETLADAVYRRDPSEELAAEVFPRLCDAVSELHEAFDPPLIHRDLKPANVMLSDGGATIIDLGIARTFDGEADEDTRRFGTRAYAPPEQFGYGQTDPRSDVYALGLLLYFCLTERTPDAKARRAGYRAPGISEPLRAVIDRAASFDPAKRFASASELKAAFLRAVSDLSTCAPAVAEAGTAGGAVAQDASWPPAAIAVGGADATGSAGGFKGMESTKDAEGAGDERGGSARKRFSPLGIAWDILLLAMLALMAVASIGAAVFPLPDSSVAGMPLVPRAICYFTLFLFIVVPISYLVSYRPPLRRLIPSLRDISLAREAVLCSLLVIAGLIAIGILGQFLPKG